MTPGSSSVSTVAPGVSRLSPRQELGTAANVVAQAVRRKWGDEVDAHVRGHSDRPGGYHALAGWETCLEDVVTDRPTVSVSVVVATCRRPSALKRCVDSLLATGYPGLEILVVDNAPDDSSTPHDGCRGVRRHAERALPGRADPGCASRARNRGVVAANGDLIAFVDDDIVVDRLWVDALVEGLLRHPTAGCVTGLVIPDRLESAIQLWFEQFGGFNRGYEHRSFDVAQNRGDTLLYPFTAGALGGLGNAAFRRSALDVPAAFEVTLGPGTPAYGAEDQDAFVSLLMAGGELLYEPSALVRHSHREEWGDLRWQMFTYGAGMVAGLVHWAWTDGAVAVSSSNASSPRSRRSSGAVTVTTRSSPSPTTAPRSSVGSSVSGISTVPSPTCAPCGSAAASIGAAREARTSHRGVATPGRRGALDLAGARP